MTQATKPSDTDARGGHNQDWIVFLVGPYCQVESLIADPISRRFSPLVTSIWFAWAVVLPVGGSEEFFENRVRPVLAAHCFSCHGKEAVEGGLAMGSRQQLIAGGDRGPALVPGQAEQSLLIRAILRTQDQLQMPPDAPLPQDVVADLVRWVNEGAVWPDRAPLDAFVQDHWAFQPVTRPRLPAATGGTNPVDRFVAARRKALGLRPVRPADPRTLIRRLYGDLWGLPPTPQQMRRGMSQLTPWTDGAWMRLIDQLLASPHYGERWGRHWLDVARYADTAGDNADYPIPEAFRYRDYVIDALNADKPYDEFVREQIAGDILAAEGPKHHYADRVTATGFLALSRRYATGPYELWHLTLEDTIDTVGQALLGMTLRCARCHDHKFDPIGQRDYYALYGVFDSTQFPWPGCGGIPFAATAANALRFHPAPRAGAAIVASVPAGVGKCTGERTPPVTARRPAAGLSDGRTQCLRCPGRHAPRRAHASRR